MFWGLTPALDLLNELLDKGSNRDEVNILIVGGTDCRHVLQTVARRYRYENKKTNFFVTEAVMENVAKQLLMLRLALEPEEEMALARKTRTFMELYGNSFVRPAVAKYLKAEAVELIKMITDADYLKQAMPNVTLDLRFKDRDYVENVYKFWAGSDDFDIQDYWDKRVRKLLGMRYDTKMNAFDWDLHMRLHSIGANQICSQEYKQFRNNGLAFTWLESEVSKSNRSLVCGVIPNGEKFVHCGYLGDIQTGPFVAFGIECEDKSMLKKTNGQNSHRATDVTERNLMQTFAEIMTGREYEHTKLCDIELGCARFVPTEARVVDNGEAEGSTREKQTESIELEDVNITYLSISKLASMAYKHEYKELFDLIYFGIGHMKYFDSAVIDNISAPKSLLIVENHVFVVSYRDDQLKELWKETKETVEGGVKSAVFIPCDVTREPHLKFAIKGD